MAPYAALMVSTAAWAGQWGARNDYLCWVSSNGEPCMRIFTSLGTSPLTQINVRPSRATLIFLLELCSRRISHSRTYIMDLCHLRNYIMDLCHLRNYIMDLCHLRTYIMDLCHLRTYIMDLCHLRTYIMDLCHLRHFAILHWCATSLYDGVPRWTTNHLNTICSLLIFSSTFILFKLYTT
jgi:hypothetical protein